MLERAGIAHGDLQHGNIFVVDDELKLIDYDGMFVPRLAGCRSNELGIEHYQHPQRKEHHFGRSSTISLNGNICQSHLSERGP